MPMLRGHLAEAEAAAEAAFALGTDSGQPDAMTFFAAQLINIRHHQGRLHEMIPPSNGRSNRPSATSRPSGPPIELSWRSPTPGKATGPAPPDSGCRRVARVPHPRRHLWTTGHACWADAAAEVGHHGCARVMRERMAPFHTHLVTPTCFILPTLAHYLGRVDHLLGRYDDADAWFAEAMQHHTRLESPLLIAYTNAAWAAHARRP